MAAPTFTLFERNGASAGTLSATVPQVAYAAVDVASTSALSAANPIAQSGFSFEKYNGLQVATIATTAISAMSFYFSGTAPTDSAAVALPVKYVGTATYAAPLGTVSTAATLATTTNVSAPGTTMTAPANTAAANSSYVVTQVQAGASAAGGTALVPSPFLVFQYTWS